MSLEPANFGVIFHIFDGSVQKDHYISVLRPDLVKRWSLGFKKSIEKENPNQVVQIELKSGSGIDCTSVVWVLENHQQKQFDITPDPKTVARYCAVLWYFECIPDSFKYLGDSTQTPQSTLNSLSDIDPQNSSNPSASNSTGKRLRCWQEGKKNNTCSELMVIAIVLGLKKKLEDVIEIAVWGTSKEIDIAVLREIKLNFDFKNERKIELGRLFDKVFIGIHEIKEENDKQAKSIQETLKQHELGSFSKSWERSSMDFERWTPYVFLQAMENALRPPEPQTRHHVSPAVVGFKELQELQPADWVNAIRKAKQATKDALHIVRGKERIGEQERKNAILKSLEESIDKRRDVVEKLATDLMTQRDLIVQSWKEKLLE